VQTPQRGSNLDDCVWRRSTRAAPPLAIARRCVPQRIFVVTRILGIRDGLHPKISTSTPDPTGTSLSHPPLPKESLTLPHTEPTIQPFPLCSMCFSGLRFEREPEQSRAHKDGLVESCRMTSNATTFQPPELRNPHSWADEPSVSCTGGATWPVGCRLSCELATYNNWPFHPLHTYDILTILFDFVAPRPTYVQYPVENEHS
jgi:hypothetical protein